jgi:hypothetical protein
MGVLCLDPAIAVIFYDGGVKCEKLVTWNIDGAWNWDVGNHRER